MSTLPTVAIAGATGSLGSAVLRELLITGIRVTILVRKGSRSTAKLALNPNQTVKEVDYNATPELTAALAGIDVVVSTLATESILQQHQLIDAAIAAGVKRLIPSEFGSDTTNTKARGLPVYEHKIEIQKTLVEKSKENPNFSYTLVFNNAFLDWGIQAGFLINARDHSATLYDGGDRPFSTTRLSTVGKAVIGILEHLEETKNTNVFIHDAVVTQNELISMVKRFDSREWTTTCVNTTHLEAAGYEELGKADPNVQSAMYGFLARAIWGEGYGGDFTAKLTNNLFGLPVLTSAEVEELVKSAVAVETL